MMGGRVAEEMIFSNQTTGAASDIKQATNIVRKVVCDYGMTDTLGPLSYGEKDEQIFLGREIARHRDYSDKTAESIDDLMHQLVTEQMQRSRSILTEHRDQLDLLAQALIEHELLDREEVMKVLQGDTLQNVRKTRSLPVAAALNGKDAAPNGTTASEIREPSAPESAENAAASTTAGQTPPSEPKT
jgi:cell division protease FtsH